MKLHLQNCSSWSISHSWQYRGEDNDPDRDEGKDRDEANDEDADQDMDNNSKIEKKCLDIFVVTVFKLSVCFQKYWKDITRSISKHCLEREREHE